ncbi:MAG: hypothetical protein, partial [Olavius algarvensis Gamma 3 endosymbiont]
FAASTMFSSYGIKALIRSLPRAEESSYPQRMRI